MDDEPKGSWGKVAGVDCYITGQLDSQRVLLAYPDLFNLKKHPSKIFQVRRGIGCEGLGGDVVSRIITCCAGHAWLPVLCFVSKSGSVGHKNW